MRRVVHLTPYYWPHVGGVETHLHHVNAELLKLDSQLSISVITLLHDPHLSDKDVHQDITIYRLPVTSSGSTFLAKTRYKLSLWRHMWTHRHLLFEADAIHIHDIFWWLIPLLPFLVRRKLFITFHGYEGNQLPKWNHIFWRKIATYFTAGNIVIGQFQAKWYGITPTAVSYGGVIPVRQKSKLDLIKTLGLKKTEVKIKAVFIGRLEPDNGLMTYLTALKEVVAQGKKIHLDVYGDGPLRSTAEKFVQRYSLPVTFHGFVENPARHLFKYNVAFVSRYLSILEALSVGVPVIAQCQNQLQHDYLTQTPFKNWITIASDTNDMITALQSPLKVSRVAQKWAQAQTWQRVAGIYYRLWQF